MLSLKTYLTTNKIEGEIITKDVPMPTCEIAAEQLGCKVSQIVKTLILKINKNQTVGVILRGDAKLNMEVLGDHFNVNYKKKIKFADNEAVLEETGYPAGGTPPLGFKTVFPVFIDQDLVDAGEECEVYAGGGRQECMLKIKIGEIINKTDAVAKKISL